jgi:hypothetical protein
MKPTQEPGSFYCGQVAVALVAGITLDEAVHVVGHKHSTKTREIVRAMRALGYTCPDTLQRIERPPLAIAKLVDTRRPRSSWHWVVCFGPYTIDGLPGDPLTMPDVRITSYLPLRRSE